MNVLPLTVSHTLTLTETLQRLMAAENVIGLAFFGSRKGLSAHPVSDYDLLVLVQQEPVAIFQMLTHIDGRMADIVLANVATAEQVVTLTEPVDPRTAEGMLIQKIYDGQILYDPQQWLQRMQQQLQRRPQASDWLVVTSASARYAAWFWQNHTLYHLKRMVQAPDAIYLTAVDLMLLTGISDLCRSYYTVRGLLWQGEKAALRYLQAHDPAYLAQLRACLAEVDRMQKIKLYEQLVAATLAAVGALWEPGSAAVYLRHADQQPARVAEALAFWEGLLGAT